MVWDYQAAQAIKESKNQNFVASGDWLYLPSNIRVHVYLKNQDWGQIDEHITWVANDYNGMETVTNQA